MTPVQSARIRDLDPVVLYNILALRERVFVVEQDCVYLDADGRDLEPDAHQLWLEDAGEIVATLRVLHDPDGAWRIGRVATAGSARGRGLAGQLMTAALDITGPGTVVLDAQSYLTDWYARFGFEAAGPEFLEDGIPHVPMRRRG